MTGVMRVRRCRDARPFHHHMSGRCFNDAAVQRFISTEHNTLCLCEQDLCNAGRRAFSPRIHLIFASAVALSRLVFYV